jgi:hypothetical protein
VPGRRTVERDLRCARRARRRGWRGWVEGLPRRCDRGSRSALGGAPGQPRRANRRLNERAQVECCCLIDRETPAHWHLPKVINHWPARAQTRMLTAVQCDPEVNEWPGKGQRRAQLRSSNAPSAGVHSRARPRSALTADRRTASPAQPAKREQADVRVDARRSERRRRPRRAAAASPARAARRALAEAVTVPSTAMRSCRDCSPTASPPGRTSSAPRTAGSTRLSGSRR